MRIVVALGGNALLRRGQTLSAENQRRNVRLASEALAPFSGEHQLVITHGNGPQVGLLALQTAADEPNGAFPLDVLGAETEGMIGYMLEQEMRNLLPGEAALATLLTMIEVDGNDAAFANPTKFVGPVYAEHEARRLAAEKGWSIALDGEKWRRVVASPQPKRIVDMRPLRWLIERGAIVICAGGGGIPTVRDESGKLRGIEAVIDKDLASELLARELDADLYLMATDVDAVYAGWGTPEQRAIRVATPDALRAFDFPAGSMGPKVEAACLFAERTGRKAAIGSLADLQAVLAGAAGTTVSTSLSGLEWH
ncbi:carbamate kinase [Nisaea sediminum]|uniref:carbamate kinase n=1 Tax=Nisaea sediminum TaxID=2775867 RepID=UPI0018661BA3|nr:carbamate kinase [Nisaea sediminum]